MKAIVLGAAGKQGGGAAGVLARRPSVTELVLTDIDGERLAAAAAGLPCPTRTVELDVGDGAAVAALFEAESDAAVVLNAVGPGFKFAPPMMRAAIAAGIDYVDIQDDAEAVDSVAELDGPAAAAGVTMVSGVGLTPGLSNVLARHAHDRLDRLDDLRIFWVSNMTERPTVANWGHRLGAWSLDVPVIEEGELAYRPGASRSETIRWPDPAGEVVQRLCAHPEPLTLHRNLDGIGGASVWGGYTPAAHDVLLAELRDLGLTSFASTAVPGVGDVVPIEFMSGFAASETFRSHARFLEVLAAEREIGDNNGLLVRAAGVRGGAAARLEYRFFSPDRNIGIYTPAAVMTYLVGEGAVERPGVCFPEQLDADEILAHVRGEGIQIDETTDDGGETARD